MSYNNLYIENKTVKAWIKNLQNKHLEYITYFDNFITVIYYIHSTQGTNKSQGTINELSGLVATCVVYMPVCVLNLEREILSPS